MFLYEARARARLVQEHQLHNWDLILASLEPGGPKNLRKPIKVNVNPIQNNQKRQPHRAQNLGFRAPEPGFGPDVVILGVVL